MTNEDLRRCIHEYIMRYLFNGDVNKSDIFDYETGICDYLSDRGQCPYISEEYRSYPYASFEAYSQGAFYAEEQYSHICSFIITYVTRNNLNKI